MTPVDRAKADVTRMDSELNRLRGQIANLQSRVAKAQAYIEMAAIYEVDETPTDGARARGGVSATAVRLAVEMIIERGAPMHTREILRELASRGVSIGGNNPVANLSGFLSRADELRNSRADGWGLAQWGAPADEEKDEEAHKADPITDDDIDEMLS